MIVKTINTFIVGTIMLCLKQIIESGKVILFVRLTQVI